MSASAGRVLLLFKGEYDGSATYAPMDVVKYGVSSFVCKQESTGNLPTNTTYWQVLAQGISNMSPEAIGIGYGVSSDSGSARTATLSDYNLTPNGIVAVTFGADVPANATLNINSQGAKPIYFRGSAIVANVIKGGDTVTFAYDGTHYDILCIDGGAGHKILNSAGTELTQRDTLQASDGLEFVDDSTNQRTKVKMNLPIVSFEDWNAMTEQEKTAYKASHYRFGVEQPDTSGVINAEYMKLLWENPNTSQAFAAQTITLSSADYDFLLCIASEGSVLVKKGQQIRLSEAATSGGTSVINRMRSANYVSDTSYSFGDAVAQNSGSNRSTDNTLLKPVAIYGIKKNFQFKVNAIASELSTRADHCFLDDETTTVEDALTYKDVYSTTEHIVGKWIDGSTIYAKSGSYTFTSLAQNVNVGTIPNVNVLINIEATVTYSGGVKACVNRGDISGAQGIYLDGSGNILLTDQVAVGTYYYTFYYTKTS